MAHDCPECGMLCHCGGDIDDILLNAEEDVIACTHCDPFDDPDDDSDDGMYYDEESGEWTHHSENT